MTQIARLKDAEISNGNLIDADDLDSEFNGLINESNAQDTRLTTIESEATTWAGVKTFSSTPLMNAINERTAASGVTIDGVILKDFGISLTDAGELTIASGAVTSTGGFHTIDTESDAASDDLDTINGGVAGRFLFVRAQHTDRSVVLKHNTGNIFNPDASDITLADDKKTVLLIYDAELVKWVVVISPALPPASDTVAGIIEIAVQSEQETGTDTTRAVVPGRQHFHPSAAKFWAEWTGTGTAALTVSYNTTSLTDNGTGDYTITIATDFSSGDWCFQYTAGAEAATVLTNSAPVAAKAAGTIRVQTWNSGTTATDPNRASVVGFGDIA